jgi:uncharacterized protein (TIGR03435 family)
MLQALLMDRFHLTYHHEMRELPVYGLVIANGGPKRLKLSETNEPPTMQVGAVSSAGQRFEFYNQSVASLVDFLGAGLDRPLLDLTGLQGRFNFVFDKPLHRVNNTGPVADQPTADPPGTDPKDELFFAIRDQLGFRVVDRKALIDLLVVDHIEKLPTDN